MKDVPMHGEAYLRWFYSNGVWKRMHYRGIRALKLPSDMWSYQEIFSELEIDWVVEAGTRYGGSALFFADLLTLNGAAGRVLTIEINADYNEVHQHPRIDFLIGDSASTEMAERIRKALPGDRGPLFMILDSDHAKAHVARELEVLTPLLRKGDYLLVEDSCINGHPVRPDFGPGPYEAIVEFLEAHPGLFVSDVAREQKFGHTFAPRGFLIKT